MGQDEIGTLHLRGPGKRSEEHEAAPEVRDKSFFYLPSLPSRVIVIRVSATPQIANFYRELADPECVSASRFVHQWLDEHFSPTSPLAYPYRSSATTARSTPTAQHQLDARLPERALASAKFLEIEKIFPLIPANQSDSSLTRQCSRT